MENGLSEQGNGTFQTMLFDEQIYLRMQCPAITEAARLMGLDADYIWYVRSMKGWESKAEAPEVEAEYQRLLKEQA